MATWYLRNATGAACGPGTRNALSLTNGLSPASMVLDATGDTWNNTLPEAGTPAGTWSVAADIAVAAGAGGDEVTCTVAIYDSACGFARHTIFSDAVAVVEGITDNYTFGSVNPGEITYHEDDVLRVVFQQTAGADACTLHFNGPTYNAALTKPTQYLRLKPATGAAKASRTGAGLADASRTGSGAGEASRTATGTATASRTGAGAAAVSRTGKATVELVRD